MNRNPLRILASGRRHRLQDMVQPKFGLTAEEIERSTGIAMRLADAWRSQAKTRAGTDSTDAA